MHCTARLVVAVALAAPPHLVAQAPRTIPVTVLTDFGGAQDDPATELQAVTGVLRTNDNRFVVVNGKPLEVRVYDARGRFERRLGRAGNGPGEFRFGAYLRTWPGDSVLTFSASTRRWMLFGLDGILVREWPLGENEAGPHGARLVGNAFSVNAVGLPVDCRVEVIRRLAPTSGALQQVAVDPAGRIWLRTATDDAWRVHDATGRVLGMLAVPGFRVSQFSGDMVVGHRLDADDFPHVMAVRPALQAAPLARLDCPTATVDSPRAGEIRATVRNAMTAAEAYYSDHAGYPKDLKSVASFLSLPFGIEGRFEPGDNPNNFAFNAWEVATGYRCLVSVGNAIRGYPDGSIACGG